MSGTCSTSQWKCKSKVKTSTFAFANFTFALLFSYLLVLKSIASKICFSRWEWAIVFLHYFLPESKMSSYIMISALNIIIPLALVLYNTNVMDYIKLKVKRKFCTTFWLFKKSINAIDYDETTLCNLSSIVLWTCHSCTYLQANSTCIHTIYSFYYLSNSQLLVFK